MQTGKTPLFMWNQKLVQRLPWLHVDETKPPMLSVLSDRSAIFEGELSRLLPAVPPQQLLHSSTTAPAARCNAGACPGLAVLQSPFP